MKLKWNINGRELQNKIQQILSLEEMSEALKKIKEVIKQSQEDGGVLELNLEGIKFNKFTPEINAVIENIKDLEVLILINCGLQTLEDFPKINLHAIDLSQNNLDDDSHLQVLKDKKNLSQIFIVENKIQKLDTVLSLKELPNLVQVDFTGNPVTNEANYRNEVFNNFPEMSIVDRKDKNGKEIEDQQQQDYDGEDDSDEDEYEAEDDSEEFQEDEDFEDQSEQKKPKRGRKKKN